MRILSVAHYYPPHMGGLEMVAKNQAERLVARGHEVSVVTSKQPFESERTTERGVHIIRVAASNILEKRGVPFPLFSPVIIGTLFRAARNADIVHIHDAFYISSFVAAVIAKLLGKPVVLMQHVAMINHPSKFVMFVQRLVYMTTGAIVLRASSKIITLNDRVENFLKKLGVPEHKLIAIPNGVDMELFHPATDEERHGLKKEFGFDTHQQAALFVGRFVPKKGFAKLMLAGDPAYQLVFCGGDRPEQIKDDAGLVFLGKRSPDEVAKIYRAADVFILPSEDEGFPLSVQEAMATGLPVITSNDVGYGRYNFDREGICLLDNTDPETLKHILKTLLGNSEKLKRMSAYSLRYAQEHFNWDSVIARLEEVYQGLIVQKTEQAPRVRITKENIPVVVTTSWDDGHRLDIKLALVLKRHGIKGTFYVSPDDIEFEKKDLLTAAQVTQLSRDFEIGAHTMTHRRFPLLTEKEVDMELRGSKEYLENLTGKPVTAFCYPRGEYTEAHPRLVKEAGFTLARTVSRFSLHPEDNPFELATTIHTYDHWLDLWDVLKFSRFDPIKFLRYYLHWDELAIALFERARTEGGIYHLWGHSWELEKNNDWDRLERVLKYIGKIPNVDYFTNSEVI